MCARLSVPMQDGEGQASKLALYLLVSASVPEMMYDDLFRFVSFSTFTKKCGRGKNGVAVPR